MSSERMIPRNSLKASSAKGFSFESEADPKIFPIHDPTVGLSVFSCNVEESKRHCPTRSSPDKQTRKNGKRIGNFKAGKDKVLITHLSFP